MPRNNGDLNAKSTAKLLSEWQQEINALTRDVTNAVKTLGDLEKTYRESWRSLFKHHLPSIAVITVSVLLFFAGVFIPHFRIDLGNVKIEKFQDQPCKSPAKEQTPPAHQQNNSN